MYTINIPPGLGREYSHMAWQKITRKGSPQLRLKEKFGMPFDPDGIGCIDGRKVIACTPKFGKIGDAVCVKLQNGNEFHAIIGDYKNENDPDCNEWGHNYGKCVVEFVVDIRTGWLGYNGNKRAVTVLPYLKNNPVVKIQNLALNYL